MGSPYVKVVFLLALSLLAHGRVMDNNKSLRNDIPARCTANSVTAVSCTEAAVADDGLLPHPDDCQLFYYCVAESLPPVCRQCPAGLHFNPAKRVCDRPENAGCAA